MAMRKETTGKPCIDGMIRNIEYSLVFHTEAERDEAARMVEAMRWMNENGVRFQPSFHKQCTHTLPAEDHWVVYEYSDGELAGMVEEETLWDAILAARDASVEETE